ncbi:MAG: hypothetical protein AUH85_04360 [Chloroflexi bacterium 13_1_40CM_4_68_4]|nr:MAG: hypothetical protein AUH85_04360 [Chloroflexi bacterium 13_1_40CM_4_68_4]
MERIRARVLPREGSTPVLLLGAIREYASQETRNPWVVRSRRPFVLEHRSPRAEGVRYELSKDGDAVSLLIAGARARLGLAYAMTMLASARFSEHVGRVELELPTPPAQRRGRR